MTRHRKNNPVETEGTTEVPRNPDADVDMRDPNQIQERSRAAEEKKEKDIAQLRKESDGEPKV